MAPWVLAAQSQSSSRIFERPLGANEIAFYWDSVFRGTADTLQDANVEIRSGNSDIFKQDNVRRAWISLKQQYPLLGARIKEVKPLEEIYFVVDEQRLRGCDDEEVTFISSASIEEVEGFIDNLLNGERSLSNEHTARIFIFTPADRPNSVHVVILAAHCITDGVANAVILRNFLNLVSSPQVKGTQYDLEERLALAASSEDLLPNSTQSVAKRRWHRAMGVVLHNIRMTKASGGHTLPRHFNSHILQNPARSCRLGATLSAEETTSIFKKCRQNGVTFGNVYPVIGQIALTRVLCRRWIRGDISPAEWEFRRTQPMYTAGPLNLRPFLDRQWYEQGGAENVAVSIGFFYYTLPFMPLGSASHLAIGDQLPSFEALLSAKRFFYRSRLLRQEAVRLLKHPLFLDMGAARMPARVERIGNVAIQWRKSQPTHNDVEDVEIPVSEQAQNGPVVAHGGSSFGNMDVMLPLDYPVGKAGRETVLHLESSTTHLRCRPGELYLGAATSGGQLRLHVFWDGNMFDTDVVKEWLQEAKDATQFYLGHSFEASSKL